MKNLSIFFLTISSFLACSQEPKTAFSPEALAQKTYTVDMQETTIKAILEQYKGKKIIIDVWASWCGDCLKSLPKIEQFQTEHPEVEFVFLSVDDAEEKWKVGLNKHFKNYNIHGDQLFFNTGWEKNGNNAFIDFLKLDWIPRYVMVDEDGEIAVYYAKSIEDHKIQEAL